jgi:hypothetical protein
MPFKTMTDMLCNNLSDNILAINSNFGHSSQIGYEHLIKHIKTNKKTLVRSRKIQGDGTCFNSAIEPAIRLPSNADKIYFVKCFSTTGETQIPGVIKEDLSDGHEVLVIFIDYLNSLNIGVNEEKIRIAYEKPIMLNYKFKLNRTSNNILINLLKLAEYFQLMELNDLTIHNKKEIDTYWIIVYPPYMIKETKSSVDDIKVSVRFKCSEKRLPRVNIFQEGKVNILGSDAVISAKLIYEFLSDLFKYNWNNLIVIKPEKDKVKSK